jgi:hypothetical protein
MIVGVSTSDQSYIIHALKSFQLYTSLSYSHSEKETYSHAMIYELQR